MALCRVLLKTFGPNDMLLLASLIATDDKSLEGYFGDGVKSELPSVPAVTGNTASDALLQSDFNLFSTAKPPKKTTIKLSLPPHLARLVGVFSPRHLRFSGLKTVRPEEGKNVYALSDMLLMRPPIL